MLKKEMIVSDEDKGEIRRKKWVEKLRKDIKRIDIEEGVGLVEKEKDWIKKMNLKNLREIILKEWEEKVKREIKNINIDVEEEGGVIKKIDELGDIKLRIEERIEMDVNRKIKELNSGKERNLNRIMERKEDEIGRELRRIELEDRIEIIENVKLGEIIIIKERENIGKSGIERKVRKNDRRKLKIVKGEVKEEDDIGISIGDIWMEVIDIKNKFKNWYNERKRMERKIGKVNKDFKRRWNKERWR